MVRSIPRYMAAVIAAVLVLSGVTVAWGALEFELLHEFGRRETGQYGTRLVQIGDVFYGTTLYGGIHGYGTIFRLDAEGTLTTVVSLNYYDHGYFPYSGLIKASDGRLYGTAVHGGVFGAGTIFRFDPSTNTMTKLHDFDPTAGAHPYGGLLHAADGALYGTTHCCSQQAPLGSVYRLNLDGSGFTTLHVFSSADGANPFDRLVQDADGALYGTTLSAGNGTCCGTVFRFDVTSSTLATLRAFPGGSDGAYPYGGVALGSDGMLYGTTHSAGPGGYGTVFRLGRDGTGFGTLRSFDFANGAHPLGGLTAGADGRLYGTTSSGGTGYGTVFRVDTAATVQTLHAFQSADATHPEFGVVRAADGTIYGTTNGPGWGRVFKLNASGELQVVHRFGQHPRHPYGAPVPGAGDALYGTTVFGGPNDHGVLYKRSPEGNVTLLHDFSAGSSGAHPHATLTPGGNGDLYGSTYSGGQTGSGTLFRLSADDSLSTLWSFDGATGAGPVAALSPGAGYLFGTTLGGGQGGGVVFRFDPAGAVPASPVVLHAFQSFRDGVWWPDGVNPYGGVVLGDDGFLLGTTVSGGPAGAGTIFKLDPNGTLAVLRAFAWDDNGAHPYGGLVRAANGWFYGTTCCAGSGYGTVFKIDASGNFVVVHRFTDWAIHGAHPHHGLTVAPDGGLYGMTNAGGAFGYGTIFKIDPETDTHSLVHSFRYSDGAWPCCYNRLVVGATGDLYGTTPNGGANGVGVMFRLKTAGIPTQLAVSGSGVYGGTATLAATLTAQSGNAAGKSVTFSLNGTAVGSATTAANGVATLAGVSLTGINAGTYADAVTAAFAAGDGFLGSSAQGPLTVARADQTIAFSGAPPTAIKGSTFSVVAQASSGLPVAIGASGACTVSGTLVTMIGGTGTCSLTANQGGDTNHNAAPEATQTTVANWDFKGFFQPVENLPSYNSVKAGSAVPVKFSLTGNQGLGILASTPASAVVACDSNASVDAIEETVTAGSSALSYDATTDQYVYVWKTDKGWAGTCRQLVVKLTDNTLHRANFLFKK